MSKRSSYRRSAGGRLRPSEYLPIWTAAEHSKTANLVFVALLQRLGVTDIRSYFHKLRIPVAFCVVVCAWYGASTYGLLGFVIGGLCGLAGPAALLWLSVIVIGAALLFAIYVLWWMALLYVLGWILFR